MCDVAEVCDGVADDCPADAFEPECQLGPDNFEIDFGNYSDVGGDDFDWARDSGGTPSSGTGPSVDHTLGTAAGYYLYTEASNPNNPNMTALLESSCITGFSGYSDAEISFWYHMLGDPDGHPLRRRHDELHDSELDERVQRIREPGRHLAPGQR